MDSPSLGELEEFSKLFENNIHLFQLEGGRSLVTYFGEKAYVENEKLDKFISTLWTSLLRLFLESKKTRSKKAFLYHNGDQTKVIWPARRAKGIKRRRRKRNEDKE